MIKNNRGFMLAEAIVSGTVVLTSIIVLYATFNRLYSLYNERISYFNIDGVYATKMMINHLMETNFNSYVNSVLEGNTIAEIINEGGCVDNVDIMCSEIKSIYNVNEMIITEYDKSVLESNLAVFNINQTFKDYIDFVVDYYDVSNNDTKYSYIILTEIKDGDNYYYANLGIG